MKLKTKDIIAFLISFIILIGAIWFAWRSLKGPVQPSPEITKISEEAKNIQEISVEQYDQNKKAFDDLKLSDLTKYFDAGHPSLDTGIGKPNPFVQ